MFHSIEAEITVLSGSSHSVLAQEICEYLKIPLGKIDISRFSDGEIYCQIRENVRGRDIFVVQPTSSPANEHVMELLIIIDALKRASAGRITAVIPYYGYARQDRKDKPRVPITSKLVADLLVSAGTDRVITMDLHAPQIQGYFNIPVDHLFAMPVFTKHIRDMEIENLTIVSPDAGGVYRARSMAKRVNATLAIIDKRRTGKNEVEALHVIGDVQDRNVVILDDIIDTAGTMMKGVDALIDSGAKDVYACATHGVLSGKAVERINQSPIKKVLLSNTIPASQNVAGQDKFEVLSIAPLFGEAIDRTHKHTSINVLFFEDGVGSELKG